MKFVKRLKKTFTRRQKPELTQAQVQLLSHIMNVTLHGMEGYREDLKTETARLWELSIPGDANGAAAFKALTYLKTKRGEFTAKYKQLADLQRTLKKLQRA